MYICWQEDHYLVIAGVFTAGVAQAYMNLYNRMPGKEVIIPIKTNERIGHTVPQQPR